MEHDQPSIGRVPRCRVIKGQVGLRQGQPLAYHLEPNWVHPQPRLEFPFTLRTTAEPLSPPEHRWRGRAIAVRHRTIRDCGELLVLTRYPYCLASAASHRNTVVVTAG
jgi:hypothetical protein